MSNHKVENVDRSAAMAELQVIRDSIDNIDASIIHMLAERFRLYPEGWCSEGTTQHAAV